MEKKISIIIPTFNSASYMDKCIESCLSQTMDESEYEIIIVDNGSSDSTPDTIKFYGENYGNVVPLIIKENIRQGGARNRGIEIAKGEYIAFVDSDDWIEPETCEMLYNAAKENDADMAGGSCYESTDDYDVPVRLKYKTADLRPDNKDDLLFYVNNCGFFWNRIYKRQFLIENNIFFPEGVFYEDSYFNFLTALYANGIIRVRKSFYHYYQRQDSTMHNRNKETQYERIVVAQKIFDDCKERGLFKDYEDIIVFKYIAMMSSNVIHTCLDKFDKPNKKQIGNIGKLVDKSYKHYMKNPYYERIITDGKVYLILAQHCPGLAIWLYKHNLEMVLAYYKAFRRKLRNLNKKLKNRKA